MTISFEVLPKRPRRLFWISTVLFFRTSFVGADQSINSRVLQFSISLSLFSPPLSSPKDRHKMARIEVLTFRVIFHSSRISYSWNIFFFFCTMCVEKFASNESCKTIQGKLLIGGNEVKKLTCGEVSRVGCTRVTFPKNVWKQELEQGKYEISFMVKRGRRKVMSAVLRNY